MVMFTVAEDERPTSWSAAETTDMSPEYADLESNDHAYSKYNPTPGTGSTGFFRVAPNNYPFYNDDEKYVPIMQADGGQLSEWQPMYNPSPEQAEIDRQKAYECGVPHGYVAPGNKYKDLPTIELTVVSLLHDDTEYGDQVDSEGRHSGGAFKIRVSPKMRISDLRNVIRDEGGILPALQKLSYAGKYMNDSNRTLEQKGLSSPLQLYAALNISVFTAD
ncbi:hypothetical protein BSKO_00514 [Bryopsis sp. KO-2023]|nr:hypothetical protein BSKO_00514 [Bryopsis sp. KO-2023]